MGRGEGLMFRASASRWRSLVSNPVIAIKQLTSPNAAIGFPLKNENRCSIPTTYHCTDLGTASDCLRQLVMPRGKIDNHKHKYPDLGSDITSVWNFCPSQMSIQGKTRGASWNVIFSPCQGDCVEFLSKTLYSQSASLHGSEYCHGLASHQGENKNSISCYENQVKLQHADFYLYH